MVRDTMECKMDGHKVFGKITAKYHGSVCGMYGDSGPIGSIFSGGSLYIIIGGAAVIIAAAVIAVITVRKKKTVKAE